MKTKIIFLLTIFLTLNTVAAFATSDTANITLDEKKLKAYDDAKGKEQSNTNRLLTTGSMAATGIGGMELAQGLSEQRADRAAEQSMSAYIATMRCSYGNGKQVKAGTEEIELPGGNDGNIMKYRAEYVTLAADLKERKTALGIKPGIESEEILDKSQMGLYDDENIGISDGAYASLYRAQMLGSEKDQQQIDDAKQTSKNRVIGGAVAAGVGVVGGIVGDELINQSLSSSTKTAQTCTESGGTWQGGRCHCPDGFIQHTKTGPCFEEQQDQETPENTPLPGQSSSSLNSNDNSDDNANDGNGSGGTDNYNSDSNSGNGGNNPSASADNGDTEVISEKPKIAGQQIVAVAPNGNNYKWDEINQDGSPKSSPAPKIQSDNTNNDEDEKDKSNANKDNKVDDKNNSIDVNVSAAQDGDSGTISTTTANPNNGNNTSNSNVNPSNAGGSDDSFTETDNSAKTPAATEQRKVTERSTQSSSKNTSTAQRPNNTNQKKSNTTNNSNLSKQDMSKNGTFAKAYGTDGKCSVYQNKSWADKSTSWCDDLYKGEWKVQFDYGLVRGKTACDTDGGVEKRLGSPAGKAGQYCWCKVTQYTPNGGAAKNLSLSWMYNKGDSSKGSCEYHCALWCASDIRTDPSIRQKMFNAK